MSKSFKKTLLSLSISAVIFSFHAQASPVRGVDGNTITWTGDGITPYANFIVERSGVPGADFHEMSVQNVNIEDFQNVYGFNNLYYKSAISFGGGNGSQSNNGMHYGDLHLSVLDSSIKGSWGNGTAPLAGIYVRSDTDDSTVSVLSNAAIDLTFTGSSEWEGAAGILAEAKGENSHADITLQAGSEIILNISGQVAHSEVNTGLLAYANNGTSQVVAEKDTVITTNGFGATGIKTWAEKGSQVLHDGHLISNGESGRGIISIVAESDITQQNNGNLVIANTDNGVIEMAGQNSIAIKAVSEIQGDILLVNDGKILLHEGAQNSIGIQAISSTKEIGREGITAYVINAGDIQVNSSDSKGIQTENEFDSGEVNIANLNTITVDGQNGYAIKAINYEREAISSTAAMNILNSGDIILSANAANATAINVNNYTSEGDVTLLNSGSVTVSGQNANAIVLTANNDLSAVNTGTITTADGSGISGETSAGNLSLVNVGKLVVKGSQSIGLTGQGLGSGDHDITVAGGATVDAREGLGAIRLQSADRGNVSVEAGSSLLGGRGEGYAVRFESASATAQLTLDNAGYITSQNDKAISIETGTGTRMEINNTGIIEGYLTASGADTTFNNAGLFNLRDVAAAENGQPAVKSVAIMQFGEGNNHFLHQGGAVLNLAPVEGEHQVDDTGRFNATGALSIHDKGISQGQLLNLNTFENAGTLNLAVNQLAGDLLAITGNSSLDGSSVKEGGNLSSGGGTFISQGGTLLLDTVLNAGGKQSQTDMLVVDNAKVGSGATSIFINNTGGKGDLTQGDGIQVVNVLGQADNQAFQLANGPLKAGAYEYTLHQGALSNPGNESFYLRATAQQINPDVGSYLANQSMAAGLFMHSLHDRLGEPQYTQRYASEGGTQPAMWIRTVAGNTKGDAAGRALSQDTQTRVVHLGGDLTRWGTESGDRYHLGIMGAWGSAETTSKSKSTGSSSRSKVEGYGVGAYLSWYNTPENVDGLYADIWGMYNWFNNEADSARDYDSRSWVTSLEMGYAATLHAFEKWRWMVEPQGQLSYVHSSVSEIKDKNGMRVDNADGNGFASRLGVRTLLKPEKTNKDALFQPFLTVNWLYNDAKNSMDFNGASMASDTPKHRFEAKVGLQTEVKKDWHIYGQLSGQLGENNYSHKAAQLGLRYNF
jgi:autotransporter family porin